MTQADVVEYIHQMTTELAKLAENAGLSHLAYILTLAAEEAGREQREIIPGSARASFENQAAPADAHASLG